jgi:hypothetical protein
MSRAIVELFSDGLLTREVAFRGGTALHNLHFDPPSRYSEDIDLVQVNAGPIGPIMGAVRDRLDPWLGQPQWKQGKGRATIFYRFESETKPITPLKLKVETNTREHFFVLRPRRIPFQVDNPWHSGAADMLTYEPEELLVDLSEALTRFTGLDPEKVVACFVTYLENDGRRVTRAKFEANVAEKMEDRLFLGDVPPLLARGVLFDPVTAFERIRKAFISRMPEGKTKKSKERR